MPGHSHHNHELEAGERFEEKYVIDRELGRGGFGMVYLAHQPAMDRYVALKVLKTNLEGHQASEAKDRFLREVKVISRLRHPHTVTIHDFGESDEHGLLYMVLEFVDGEALDDILERQGAQRPARALTLSTQIARSLSEAHNHGVVHRDLKPANIMVTRLEGEGDFVKVLDFGIAQLLARSSRDLTQVTGDSDGEKIIGTPRYMSPEQVRGAEVDARSDIYCLGLLLYEMLVGQPAVRGETTMALISQQVSPEPLELRNLNAFPQTVVDILRRSTAKNPEERYSDADQLVEDLQTAVHHDYAGDSSGRVARAGSSSSAAIPASAESDGSRKHDATMTPPADTASTADRSDSNQNSKRHTSPDDPAPGGDAGLFEPDELEDTDDRYAGAPPPAVDKNPWESDSKPPDERDPPSDQPSRTSPPADQSGAPERPTPTESSRRSRRSAGVFGLSLAALLAVAGLYTAFATVGALLGDFVSNSTRLLATATLGVGMPMLGALLGSSDQRRFDKQAPTTDIWSRRLSSVGVLCVGTAMLVCLIFPARIIPRLKSEPNWFLPKASPSMVSTSNTTLSRHLSVGLEESLVTVGMYDPPALQPSTPFEPTVDDRQAARRPEPEERPKRKESESDPGKNTDDGPTKADSTADGADDQSEAPEKESQYQDW